MKNIANTKIVIHCWVGHSEPCNLSSAIFSPLFAISIRKMLHKNNTLYGDVNRVVELPPKKCSKIQFKQSWIESTLVRHPLRARRSRSFDRSLARRRKLRTTLDQEGERARVFPLGVHRSSGCVWRLELFNYACIDHRWYPGAVFPARRCKLVLATQVSGQVCERNTTQQTSWPRFPLPPPLPSPRVPSWWPSSWCFHHDSRFPSRAGK